MKYKYTDYIVNGNIVDVNSLVSENKYMRIVTIPLASTVAIAGVAIFACLIPMTITVDSARHVMFHYIKTKRKYNVNYVFLIPIDKLDNVVSEWHIRFNLQNELRKNEINMKMNLLYFQTHIKNLFLR